MKKKGRGTLGGVAHRGNRFDGGAVTMRASFGEGGAMPLAWGPAPPCGLPFGPAHKGRKRLMTMTAREGNRVGGELTIAKGKMASDAD
jgi:hypothetical protein